MDDVIYSTLPMTLCDLIMMSLGLYSNVWQRLIIISIQVVKELT